MSTVSKNIRKVRLACSYTQEHLAKVLGISVKTVGEIERGHARLYLELLESIAQALDTDVSTLMGLSNRLDNTPPLFKTICYKSPCLA